MMLHKEFVAVGGSLARIGGLPLMETARIAQILDEMGTILEVQGENPFRCRAYHNAAQVLSSLPADLSEMIADGIPG